MTSLERKKKNIALCISCDAHFNVGANPKIGSFVVCNVCDSEMEIVGLNPLVLDWPFYDEEDEEYEDEPYDEYEEYDEDDDY